MSKKTALIFLTLVAISGCLFLVKSRTKYEIHFEEKSIREQTNTTSVIGFQTNQFIEIRSTEDCRTIARTYASRLPPEFIDQPQCVELLEKALWLAANPSLNNLTNIVSENAVDTDFGPRTSTFLSFWTKHLHKNPKSFADRLQFMLDVRATNGGANGPTKVTAMAVNPLIVSHSRTNQPFQYSLGLASAYFDGTFGTGLSDAAVAKDHPAYSPIVTPIDVVVFYTTTKYNDSDLASPLMFTFYRSVKYHAWMPYCVLAAETKYSPLL